LKRFLFFSSLLFFTGTTSVAQELRPRISPKARSSQEASIRIDFEKSIRPILKSYCVGCHGLKKQEGGLRLDHRDAAVLGGDSGPVLKAGKHKESELYRRISSKDEDDRMPPVGLNAKPLSLKQIDLIKKWIDSGANWPKEKTRLKVVSDHWSFQPIRKPKLPEVRGKNWGRNPIDRFVLKKIEEHGTTPSAEADRYTLIKRLYYDLHGLPPTPEKVKSFVEDKSPRAYEQLVDRLLASPHFGERWGRHWLDKARYADSDGYEKDRPRMNAWRYRDWVIDAVNRDMPFDQFTREQLAGDLLPHATEMQKLATAFHRQTLTNTEGGTDKEEFRVAAIIDRINTTATVWLGLTVGCAQCHSHKFDPISQTEFYQFFAFFNNGDERTTKVVRSESALKAYQVALAKHHKKLPPARRKLQIVKSRLMKGFSKWETKLANRLKDSQSALKFHDLEILEAKTQSTAVIERREKGVLKVSGKNPSKDTYTLTVKIPAERINGFRLEALSDKSLPSKGPGRTPHGNFVVTHFKVERLGKQFPRGEPQKEPRPLGSDERSRSFTPALSQREREPLIGFIDPEQQGATGSLPASAIRFSSADSDFSQKGFPPENALDKNPRTGWAIGPKMGRDHYATFFTRNSVKNKKDSIWRITLEQNFGGQHSMGRFRIRAISGDTSLLKIPMNVRAALKQASNTRKPKERKTIEKYFLAQFPAYQKLESKFAKLQKKAPKSPYMNVRIIEARQSDRRKTHIFRRGDFLQPQNEVQPETLAVLHPVERKRKPNEQLTRLDLANWLMSKKNPLTPRVLANDVWSHLFGKGLVRTPNDFGTRGEPPTHPKLLDWLANEYRRLNWSRKAFIKRIVMSSTYRQSSKNRTELSKKDAENRLIARQNRYRVEGEIVRDLYLSVSGLLDSKIGGPSVFPPMPADVAALSYAGNFRWKTSPGGDRYRRGMYTFFKRTSPHPNLTTFDCPDSNTTCIKRQTSNTPLMALTTLNNIVFVEAAEAMSKRILADEKLNTDKDRMVHAFSLCVARPPSSSELVQLVGLLNSARNFYKNQPEAAKKLVGKYAVPGKNVDESAAWMTTLRIVMNLDEFLTRE